MVGDLLEEPLEVLSEGEEGVTVPRELRQEEELPPNLTMTLTT